MPKTEANGTGNYSAEGEAQKIIGILHSGWVGGVFSARLFKRVTHEVMAELETAGIQSMIPVASAQQDPIPNGILPELIAER